MKLGLSCYRMECQGGRASRERLGHLRSVEIASNANNRRRKEGRKEGRSNFDAQRGAPRYLIKLVLNTDARLKKATHTNNSLHPVGRQTMTPNKVTAHYLTTRYLGTPQFPSQTCSE